MKAKRRSFYQDKVRVPSSKCKKPSFKDVKGMTWDSGRIKVNGVEVDAFLDTSWGEFIYIQFGEKLGKELDVCPYQWYKMRMQSTSLQYLQGQKFDVDPFANEIVELVYE